MIDSKSNSAFIDYIELDPILLLSILKRYIIYLSFYTKRSVCNSESWVSICNTNCLSFFMLLAIEVCEIYVDFEQTF